MDFRERFAVEPGKQPKLADRNTRETCGFRKGARAETGFTRNVERLAELQYLLYAESRRALLIILQAMDAGGKDSTIRHVMSAMNPQGCRVTSFKAPSAEEASHDFLWRIHRAVPRRGEVGVFNRSHYEDVLVVRVHDLVPRSVWSRRYRQINDFERLLAENDVVIVKFFLHISREEQRERFQSRLDKAHKNWKVNPADFEERRYWDDYMKAYETALARCNKKWALWYVIPADRKWFRNLAVSSILVDTLEELKMQFPKPICDPSEIVLD